VIHLKNTHTYMLLNGHVLGKPILAGCILILNLKSSLFSVSSPHWTRWNYTLYPSFEAGRWGCPGVLWTIPNPFIFNAIARSLEAEVFIFNSIVVNQQHHSTEAQW